MSENLFRFFQYNENDLHSLSSSYLWFTDINNFNDPFEGCFNKESFKLKESLLDDETFLNASKNILAHKGYGQSVVDETVAKYKEIGKYEEFKQNQIDAYTETLNEIVDEYFKYKFCCFCRNREQIPAFLNKQMWSYYGNGLRGYAIEFDRDVLINSIESLNKHEVLWSEIHYGALKEYAIKDIFKKHSFDANDHSGINEIINRKDSFWEYEKELRLSINTQSNVITYSPKSIKRIYIGSKMSAIQRKALFTIIKGLDTGSDIDVFECQINPFEISLEVNKITY